MAAKDYYFILGIPRSASGHSIRTAFHALAKKLHPDRAGPGTAAAFRDVVEAYEVLSDPVRREEHDASLRGAEVRAEPLVQESEPFGRERTVAGRGGPFDPLSSALLDELLGGFRPRVHGCEVVLTRAEARRGTVVPLALSLPGSCPLCTADGWSWACPRCDGRGWLWSRHHLEIHVPPGVRTGETLDLALRSSGVRDEIVRLHIHVRP